MHGVPGQAPGEDIAKIQVRLQNLVWHNRELQFRNHLQKSLQQQKSDVIDGSHDQWVIIRGDTLQKISDRPPPVRSYMI